MIKKFYKYIGEIKGLILIIYTTLILTISVFNKHYNNMTLVLFAFLIFLSLSILICPRILRLVGKIQIKKNNENINYKRWFIIISLISLLIFIILFIIHYPGFFCEDVMDQYAQALKNSYDDWHPVMHTLFALKLPLLFTSNNWIGMTTIFQFIELALVISYAVTTILKYTNRKIAIICFLFIILNPNVRIASFVVDKDVTFAMGAMLLLTYMMNIYFSKGKWLEKKLNIFVFILALVLTTLFRHNAILFTAPLIISVLFFIDRKKWVKIAVVTALSIVVIRGSMFCFMNVGKAPFRKSETLGIPLNIIGSVYLNDRDNMDNETLSFIRKTAPKKALKKYDLGDFNSVKGSGLYNQYIIENYGYIKTGKMVINTIKSSPKYALLGFTKTTYPVYTITENYACLINEILGAYDYKYKIYGLRLQGTSELEIKDQEISHKIIDFCPFFKYIGLMNLLVIIAMLAQKNYKKILIALPMLSYNFGTMMLLYTRFDTTRYFFYSFLITPIILVILLREEEQK